MKVKYAYHTSQISQTKMITEKLERRECYIAKKLYYSQVCLQKSLRVYKYSWVALVLDVQMLSAMPYLC